MLRVLVITDDKLSSLNQCNSLINELKKSVRIKPRYIKIQKKIIHFFPNSVIYLKLLISFFFGHKFNKEKIDLIISCGRIAAPYNLIFKMNHNCKNCHILNPYFKKKEFSKIIIPEYDSFKFSYKNNLITTKGTLVDLEKINLKKNEHQNILKNFDKTKKIVLILIGGNGKSSKVVFNDLKATILNLNKQKKIEIIYCFSRRTSESLKAEIIKNKNKNSLFFPDKFFNPYWELINIADYIFVTADSISMTSDALSTGKPTYVIPIKKIKSKIEQFHINLNSQNITRFYNARLQKWKYKRFEESKRVGKELHKFLNF